MPDESCRTCGGELVRYSRCSECREIIQKVCTECNLKTHKEFHPKCLRLEMYQTSSKKTHVTAQSVIYKTPEIKKTRKNISNSTFLLSGIIVISVAGFMFGNYLVPMISNGSPSEISNNEMQSIEPTNQIQFSNVIKNQDSSMTTHSSFKAQYANCLGISDGNSLTINCPTDYGIVYKAIVKIPDDLMLQFESKVFHMRNFSVLENSNDLLIEYQKQTYVTTFMTG